MFITKRLASITIFLGKTSWQKLSVGKSLSSLRSHVPLNSSICQSEDCLNLFSPEPFWLFISCLHDDAYLSTMVIKEQIKKSVKLPNVFPRHKANWFNKAQNGLGSFLNSKLLFKESLPKRDNKYLRKLHRICRLSNGCLIIDLSVCRCLSTGILVAHSRALASVPDSLRSSRLPFSAPESIIRYLFVLN